MATPTAKTVATPTAKTVATPTAKTPEGIARTIDRSEAGSAGSTDVTDAWITRREFHVDAPRLADLVADPGCFEAGSPALRRISVDAPWGDAERLWDRFLTAAPERRRSASSASDRRWRRREYCRSAPIGNEQVDDVVEPNRVLEHYTSGATVVLQALQFTDPVFAELSTNLALELDHPVQVNAYLTPPAERGLDIHFDFHDVVVVQLAGRKRWRVWPPLPRTERPLKRGPSISQPTARRTRRGAPRPCSRTRRLPGDSPGVSRTPPSRWTPSPPT